MSSRATLIAAALLVLSAALTTSSAAQKDYLALITDVDGKIEVAPSGRSEFKPAMWGMQLFAGDRVRTTDGSEVSILFANNNLVTLGPNSAMTISEGPGSTRSAAVKSIKDDLYGTLADLRLQDEGTGRGRAIAGLRAGADDPALQPLTPRNTKLNTTRPDFRWSADQEFDGYTVKLYDADGLVWSRYAESSLLDYPEDEAPLTFGSSYFWQVEGETLLGAETSEKVGFSVLSEELSSEVAEQELTFKNLLNADDRSASYALALGVYYIREGLLDAAIASFSQIAERHPDAVLPHEILGRLYNEIGLEDLAVAELHRAVSLSGDE